MSLSTQEQSSALSPTSKTDGRLLYLDGWRGVAILAVFAGHFVPLSSVNAGRLGVELFFVLSGRLMAEILFINQFPLGQFYRRRISRIWPAMLAFLLVARFAFTWSDEYRVSNFDVLTAVTLTLNYAALYLHSMPVIENLWSLCIEEWAYILLGIFAYVMRRRGGNPVVLILIVALLCMINGIAQSLAGSNYYFAYWRTDTRIAGILMSAGLYLLFRQKGWIAPSWGPIVFGVAGYLLHHHAVPDYIRYSAGTTCFAISVVTIDKAPKWLLRVLSHRVVVLIGLWSFSLYLWQQPFYFLNADHMFPRKWLVLGAVAAGLTSFYLVEQPARRFLNARWKKRALAAA